MKIKDILYKVFRITIPICLIIACMILLSVLNSGRLGLGVSIVSLGLIGLLIVLITIVFIRNRVFHNKKK